MKTSSNSSLRPQIWSKELFADVIDNLYFTVNGLMGKDSNNIIQIKSDLEKQKGDRVTIPLTAKLSGSGVNGDSELEGNEEKISASAQSIIIDQKRHAVRLEGKLDEQKNALDMRKDAKDKLSIWMQEFIERQAFLKLAGVTNTTLVDVNGEAYSADALWANTPAFIADADTAAGSGARYLAPAGAASLAATDLMTPALISRAKSKAETATPKIQPLRIDGRNKYVMFIHPWQAFALKRNPEWIQAQREAGERGSKNAIFTGALGEWDDVVIMVHEYVPFLNTVLTSTGGTSQHSFRGTATGTDYAVNAARAILCGRQAGVFAQCKNPSGWVEKDFDYDNQTGFATGMIGGFQKTLFTTGGVAKEYSTIVVDTAVVDPNA